MAEHCLTCDNARVKLDALLTAIYSKLEDRRTDPDIVSAIRLCTTYWLTSPRESLASYLAELPLHFHTVFMNFYDSNWCNFFEGLHLSTLTDLQAQYFSTIRCQ